MPLDFPRGVYNHLQSQMLQADVKEKQHSPHFWQDQALILFYGDTGLFFSSYIHTSIYIPNAAQSKPTDQNVTTTRHSDQPTNS